MNERNETHAPIELKPGITISRRGFLKLAAAAGVTTTGGYALSIYAPWLNYAQQTQQTWNKPLNKDRTISDQMRALVYFATLAANGHNTQPWRFAILEKAVEIHPDYTRRLSVVDPADRALWISLGCALENLTVAARAAGYAPEVIYPESQEFIRVNLTADTPQPNALFEAIPRRQCTRSEYDGQLIKTGAYDQIQALALEPGVSLRFVTNPAGLETVAAYVNQGNLAQYVDETFVNELIEWLRFTKKEAMALGDGLYSACSGNPQVPRWLGRMVVKGTNPQQQADRDTAKLRSSAGAVVIASDADDKATWVRVGQVAERLALQMTALNIKSAFLNQPIEVTELRAQFQSAMGLGAALPQLLLRFGYAQAMPRSLRRPLEEVLKLE